MGKVKDTNQSLGRDRSASLPGKDENISLGPDVADRKKWKRLRGLIPFSHRPWGEEVGKKILKGVRRLTTQFDQIILHLMELEKLLKRNLREQPRHERSMGNQQLAIKLIDELDKLSAPNLTEANRMKIASQLKGQLLGAWSWESKGEVGGAYSDHWADVVLTQEKQKLAQGTVLEVICSGLIDDTGKVIRRAKVVVSKQSQ